MGACAPVPTLNPGVQAPTPACDDGTTPIVDHAETLAGRGPVPAGADERQRALRLVGRGLAACEKAVRIVCERRPRPSEKPHAPWLARATDRLVVACTEREVELARRPPSVAVSTIDPAGVTAAVAWRFIRETVMDDVDAPAPPAPAAHTHAHAAERLDAFAATPFERTPGGGLGLLYPAAR